MGNRRLRIVAGKRTLTTYSRFRKRFPKKFFLYNRRTKTYEEFEVFEQIEIPPEPPVKPEKRTRVQKALNTKYNMSLRAIGFNNQTEEELDAAIDEFMFSNDNLLNASWSDEGFERTEIDAREDIGLSQDKITMELNIRGETTYTEL